MENKIFIYDPEKRHNNESEDQLPYNATLAFVIGRKQFTVKINNEKDGLIIREVSGEALAVYPNAQNSINVY